METKVSRYPDPFDLIGRVVDHKYAIEEVVGEGGFSIVYRAMHLIWKRPVAIKAFRLGNVAVSEREALVEAFVREGALLAELSERSIAICQARDVATLTTPAGDWVPYLVLEWIEGETLDAIFSETRGLKRALGDCLRILAPAIEALALAHEAGIVHRDVKPANLFVLENGRGVKLVDFGIAKVVRDAQRAGGRELRGAYTPGYAAPEQVSPSLGETGPWTDVFALALILVEMISGHDALEGQDLPTLQRATLDPSSRPTPRARGAVVSDAVEAVFAKALAVKPGERYTTARAFHDALRAALAEAPVQAAAPLREAREPSVVRRALQSKRARSAVSRSLRAIAWAAVIVATTLATRARVSSLASSPNVRAPYSAAPAARISNAPLPIPRGDDLRASR